MICKCLRKSPGRLVGPSKKSTRCEAYPLHGVCTDPHCYRDVTLGGICRDFNFLRLCLFLITYDDEFADNDYWCFQIRFNAWQLSVALWFFSSCLYRRWYPLCTQAENIRKSVPVQQTLWLYARTLSWLYQFEKSISFVLIKCAPLKRLDNPMLSRLALRTPERPGREPRDHQMRYQISNCAENRLLTLFEHQPVNQKPLKSFK